ncbi:SPOR domain-containing protein [Vibrio coralliirubri]|uniref:SPOR domain-containing protein n=1 Tax=Vibrio coralliirubri TaxID=1516159 RepID=UPI000EFBFF18|nr:SPOR domain-containing protein [Vibrio coralliirubri]
MKRIIKPLLVLTLIAFSTGCVQKRNIEKQHIEGVGCEDVITEQRINLREAFYVQIFTSKTKENANRVLNAVKPRFPDNSAVIKTSGRYKVVLGPYEDDKIKAVRDNISMDKDFSSAFIITYFTHLDEPIPMASKKETIENTNKITEKNINE